MGTIGGGASAAALSARRRELGGEAQRRLEAHIRTLQMKYEILNPSVELLRDIQQQSIDMRLMPARVRDRLSTAPTKAYPASAAVKRLVANSLCASSFPAAQPALRLPLPLPSPSPTFTSPFESGSSAVDGEGAMPLTFGGTRGGGQAGGGGGGSSHGGDKSEITENAQGARTVRFAASASASDSHAATRARARGQPHLPAPSDPLVEAVCERALAGLAGPAAHPFAGSADTSSAAARDTLQRQRGQRTPRFRTPSAPAFANVAASMASGVSMSAAIPSTDTARVNLRNWQAVGLDAPPPPGTSFGVPPDEHAALARTIAAASTRGGQAVRSECWCLDVFSCCHCVHHR